ncbi:MFS transporter, SIT family, siderophore-iron:H+ symporter [Ilyonectria robusta]
MDSSDPKEEGSIPNPEGKTNAPETVSPEPSVNPEEKLPGVVRMEAFNEQITFTERCLLFSIIFLVGYAFGLDLLVRSTYQGYATSSYSQHAPLDNQRHQRCHRRRCPAPCRQAI